MSLVALVISLIYSFTLGAVAANAGLYTYKYTSDAWASITLAVFLFALGVRVGLFLSQHGF